MTSFESNDLTATGNSPTGNELMDAWINSQVGDSLRWTAREELKFTMQFASKDEIKSMADGFADQVLQELKDQNLLGEAD